MVALTKVDLEYLHKLEITRGVKIKDVHQIVSVKRHLSNTLNGLKVILLLYRLSIKVLGM